LALDESSLSELAPIAGTSSEPVGRFRYYIDQERWWWSDGLFRMHGFEPGEVVPTTSLMLAHQHPDDRARGLDAMIAALADGKPFSSRHRIIDAKKRVHTVVTIGDGFTDPDGTLTQVRGYFIDVTDSLHRDLTEHGTEVVRRSAEARAAIEQAKGALMVAYGISEDEAFAVLSWHSQHLQIRVRDLAETLTAALNAPKYKGLSATSTIGEILGTLADGSEQDV
jgi:hypothetical protein